MKCHHCDVNIEPIEGVAGNPFNGLDIRIAVMTFHY